MRAICLKGYETFKALSREEKEPFYELVKEKRLIEKKGLRISEKSKAQDIRHMSSKIMDIVSANHI